MKIILLSFFLIYSGCSLRLNHHKNGECLKEIDKRYVADHKASVYRIDKAKIGFGYWISQHRGKKKAWQKLGRKRFSYFDETDMFKYKKIDCPGGAPKKVLKLEGLNLGKISKGFKKRNAP